MIRVIVFDSFSGVIYTMRKEYGAHGYKECFYVRGYPAGGSPVLIPVETVAVIMRRFKACGYSVKVTRTKEFSPFEIATFYSH